MTTEARIECRAAMAQCSEFLQFSPAEVLFCITVLRSKGWDDERVAAKMGISLRTLLDHDVIVAEQMAWSQGIMRDWMLTPSAGKTHSYPVLNFVTPTMLETVRELQAESEGYHL